MLVVIFAIRFGEACLQDIAIESNVIEKGSVGRLLNGKHYNRGVRLHKLFHKVCMRLILKEFITRISEDNEQNSILEDLISELELLCNDLKPSIFTNLLSSVHVAKVCLLLKQYKNYLRTEMGTMAKFWMSCGDLAEISLDLIGASQEENWCLHLMAVEDLIPRGFAYNHTNYASCLSRYLQNMHQNVTEHPEPDEYL